MNYIYVIYGAVRDFSRFVTNTVPSCEERRKITAVTKLPLEFTVHILYQNFARYLNVLNLAASQVAFYVIHIYCFIFYFDLVISFYRPSCFITRLVE